MIAAAAINTFLSVPEDIHPPLKRIFLIVRLPGQMTKIDEGEDPPHKKALVFNRRQGLFLGLNRKTFNLVGPDRSQSYCGWY